MSNSLAVILILLGVLFIWAGWSGNYVHLLIWWKLNPTTVSSGKGA